ncbi:MAG: carboxypeptidase regulatory-like domain-containing protein, partial [Planctomycetaceae bacterium]|nr:carboxypeptidase regulatory-like domain-containing protein [Planctomycetaceae bacterium]
DGYFVDAVATPGIPIYFFLPGYKRMEVFSPESTAKVRNVGSHTMVSTPRAGKVTADFSTLNTHLPESVNAHLEYHWQFLNQCNDNSTRDSIAKTLFQRVSQLFPPMVVYENASGTIHISNVANLPTILSVNSQDGAVATSHCPAVAAEENRHLGPLKFGFEPVKRIPWHVGRVQPESTLDSVPFNENGKPLAEKLLTNLRSTPRIREQFYSKFDAALKRLNEWRSEHGTAGERSAVVVFGQIKVHNRPVYGNGWAAGIGQDWVHVGTASSGQDSGQIVHTADDGYWAALVRPGVPIPFTCHGHMPEFYTPRGSKDGVESFGTISLRRLSANECASLSGSITIEDGPGNPRLRIRLFDQRGSSTADFGPTTDFRPNAISADQFRYEGLSPMPYSFQVSAPGCRSVITDVEFSIGQRVRLPPIRLQRERQVRIRFVTARNGELQNIEEGTMAFEANSNLIPQVFKDFKIRVDLDRNDERVSAYAYMILDLGTNYSVKPCSGFNPALLYFNWSQSSVFACPLRTGHSYCVAARSSSSRTMPWILFTVDDISMVSE